MAESNDKRRSGLKARAAIMAGCLALAVCPVAAYAAGNGPQMMGAQGQASMTREQVVVQDRMAVSENGAPQMGEQPPAMPDGEMPQFDGEEPPALPDGQMPTDGEEPPALPDGEMPTDGEEPPALPDGEMPTDGEEPPALPDGEMPQMDGQLPQNDKGESIAPMQTPDQLQPSDQQPSGQQSIANQDMTPFQQFLDSFFSFFERLLGNTK